MTEPTGQASSTANSGPTDPGQPVWGPGDVRPTGVPQLLTIQQVAETLNVSRSTAYHLCNSGELLSVRFGRNCRVDQRDLEAFINRNRGVA